jgi:hypothetical protein
MHRTQLFGKLQITPRFVTIPTPVAFEIVPKFSPEYPASAAMLQFVVATTVFVPFAGTT